MYSFNIKGKEIGLCIYIILLLVTVMNKDYILDKANGFETIRIEIVGEFGEKNIVKYHEQVINKQGDTLKVFIDKKGSYKATIYNSKNEVIDSANYTEDGMLKVLGTDIIFNIKNRKFGN